MINDKYTSCLVNYSISNEWVLHLQVCIIFEPGFIVQRDHDESELFIKYYTINKLQQLLLIVVIVKTHLTIYVYITEVPIKLDFRFYFL